MNIHELELLDDDELLESEIAFEGEYINTITKEQLEQVIKEYFEENDIAPKSKIGYITIYSNKWIEISNRRYTQVVEVNGATSNTQVNLAPSEEQLDIFYDKEVMLSTTNVDGVITVTLIGQKLENDYTIQVTLTEVEYE